MIISKRTGSFRRSPFLYSTILGLCACAPSYSSPMARWRSRRRPAHPPYTYGCNGFGQLCIRTCLAPLYDRARCDTPSVKTHWISIVCCDKPKHIDRNSQCEGGDASQLTYAKLRDVSRPHYSHSIISNDVSSLICKHKSSNLTDKCRRYTRRKVLVLNSQENLAGFERLYLQQVSESIGALDGLQTRNGLLLCSPRLAADAVIWQSDGPQVCVNSVHS